MSSVEKSRINDICMSFPLYGLGFEKVDLRTVWSSESKNFTPWLAKAENLKLLSDAIGVELKFSCFEKNIGGYRADLACKILVDGSLVLIENQLEKTDHNHLGQILTYAAGLEAEIIIWIAASFTKEHCDALNWLNHITGERMRFFGVEIKCWQKNGIIFADFLIVSRPND